MIIDIIQKKISFDNIFKISVDNIEKYKAYGTSTIFGGQYYIKDLDDNQVCIIERKISLIKTNYKTIIVSNGEVFRFRSTGFFGNSFSCINNNRSYSLSLHHGHLASVFKDENQIAAVLHDPVKLIKGDEFSIIADDDADEKILISMVIIYDDLFQYRTNLNFGMIDIGYFSLKGKQFDEAWTPKIIEKS